MKRLAVFGALALILFLPGLSRADQAACLVRPTYDCLMVETAALSKETSDPAMQAIINAYVARIMVEVGDSERAEWFLELANTQQARVREPLRRERLLWNIVRTNALMGRLHMARSLAAELREPYQVAAAYAWLAYGEALRGDRNGAMRSIETASLQIEHVEPPRRALLLGWLAIAQASVGAREDAVREAERAYELANTQEDRRVAILPTAVAAVALADAGRRERAVVLLAEAEGAALDLNEDPARQREAAIALSFMAWAQVRAGETIAARRNADRLMVLVPDAESPVTRAIMLGVSALAVAQAGR